MWSTIAIRWCRTMHSAVMWPMNGRYVCLRCLREYTVDWPARSVHPAFKPSFGVRATQLPVETVRGVPPVPAPQIVREKTPSHQPLQPSPAIAQRVESSAPVAAGIFVGRLGQDRQLVPFF